MGSILARLRSVRPRYYGFAAAGVVVLFVIAVAVLGSPQDLLGLLEFAIYIVAILGISAAVTYAVIRLSPVQKKPKSTETT